MDARREVVVKRVTQWADHNQVLLFPDTIVALANMLHDNPNQMRKAIDTWVKERRLIMSEKRIEDILILIDSLHLF